MPHHEQSLPIGDQEQSTLMLQVYETIKILGWEFIHAADNSILASTPKSWKKNAQHVLLTVSDSILTVRSEMINNEIMDLPGSNKKNVRAFITAFEQIQSTTDPTILEQNHASLASLQESTREAALKQQADQEELDKAMNITGSNLYVTYTLIALNIIVFIIMGIDGAGIMMPNPAVHIKWGSNFSPLTLSGDWWRLFTSTFIHFGVVHVVMNMYCHYTVGIYLEPMLGKWKYTAAYVCTGIIASVVSLWWHTDGINSAGASGAVFGMYGVFLAMLSSNLIPKAARANLLKSIAIFIGFNLLYGMKAGVDNAAHVGGLVSGFVIGFLYVYGLRKERQEEVKVKWILPVVFLLTMGLAAAYLQQNRVSDDVRSATLRETHELSYKDAEKFNENLNQFDLIHNRINEAQSDTTLTDQQFIEKIDAVCNPGWLEAIQLIRPVFNFDISPASKQKATKLLQYIQLRQDELVIQRQMAVNGTVDELMPSFIKKREQANALFEELVKQ